MITGLAKRAGLKLECQMEKKTRWDSPKEVKGDIENFYFHPNISYSMPGKDIFPQVFSKQTSPMKALRCTFLEKCFLIFIH